MELTDKLNLLREKAKDPSVDAEDFSLAIAAWEKEIEKQNLLKEYREADMSKQIVSLLVSVCIAITRKLIIASDPIERAGLEADLGRCKWLLNIYSQNPINNIKQIESSIDEELERFELVNN